MDYLLLLAGFGLAFAVSALALSLLADDLGMVTLAGGGFAAVGAYSWALSMAQWSVGGLLALIIAGITGILAGLLAGVLVGGLEGDSFVLGTLAVQFLVLSVIRNWSELTNGNLGLSVKSASANSDAVDTSLVVALVLVAVSAALVRGYRSSRWAVLHHAIRDDSLLANSLGRSSRLARTIMLGTAAGGIALGGAAYGGILRFLHPDGFSLDLSILLLAIVIISGRLHLASLVAVSVGIVLVPEALRFLPLPDGYNANVRQIVYNLVLVGGVWLRFGKGRASRQNETQTWEDVGDRLTSDRGD